MHGLQVHHPGLKDADAILRNVPKEQIVEIDARIEDVERAI